MAAILSPFQFSWKALNSALNQIVDAINRNAPLEGENIHLDEKGKLGVSINAIKSDPGTGQSTGTGTGVTGSLLAVTLFDASGNPVTLNVWTDGNTPQSSSLFWANVAVTDPVSCVTTDYSLLSNGA